MPANRQSILLGPWGPARPTAIDDSNLSPHGTSLRDIEWRLSTSSGDASTSGKALPLRTGGTDHVECRGILEFVRDDETLIQEITRIMRTDGTLEIVAPRRGPISWLDHLNAYRYLRDISKRGSRAPELAEIGWRRHYREREIRELLENNGFQIIRIRLTGAGIAEPPLFAVDLLFRWLWCNEHLHRLATRVIAPIDRFDKRIHPGIIGACLEVTARRL